MTTRGADNAMIASRQGTVSSVDRMEVVVNGTTREVPEGSTLAQLIETLGMRIRNVVVERNGDPVDRATLRVVMLESGDVLEIVRPVQGG